MIAHWWTRVQRSRRARRIARDAGILTTLPPGTPVPEAVFARLRRSAESGELRRADPVGQALTAFTLGGPPAPATGETDPLGHTRSAAREILIATGPTLDDWVWATERCQFRTHGLIYRMAGHEAAPHDLLAQVFGLSWDTTPWCIWGRPNLEAVLADPEVARVVRSHVRGAPHEGSQVLRTAWRESAANSPQRRALWRLMLDTVPEVAAELVPEAHATSPLSRDEIAELCAHPAPPIRLAAFLILE